MIPNRVLAGSSTSSNPTCVAAQRCGSYDLCEAPIRSALEASGLSHRLAGSSVLLKPNLMRASPPEHAEATHPAFVGALVRILVGLGCSVVVGDSSGLLGLSTEVMEQSGMGDAVRRSGGTPLSLDKGPFKSIDVRGVVSGKVWVPQLLFDVDHVLQVPKLKAHTLTGMSCSIKNAMGMLPGATKCDLHVKLPTARLLSEGLIDILEALRKAGVSLVGTVVDAVWAQGGKGTSAGAASYPTQIVLASQCLAAADLVAARLLVGPMQRYATVNAARRRGLGPPSWEHVALVGDAIPLPRPTIAAAEPTFKDRAAMAHRAYYALRARIVSPVHDATRCCNSGACVSACPTNCIQVRGGVLSIGASCIRCFACVAACPNGAMGLHVPRLLRGAFAKRAAGLTVDGVLR